MANDFTPYVGNTVCVSHSRESGRTKAYGICVRSLTQ
jgi:hypothetical protein